ncbi:unnamed protein product [Pipistrellus nathusii]|uniref:Uncharacterized protein n=1 Tax=Pipistrellus nathusii TaxID=59473 RepID=A0ABN9ZA33_PIPNA
MCLGRRSPLWPLARGNVLELPRREETRAGYSPGERCSLLPAPRHSVRSQEGLPLGLCFPTSCVRSVPGATPHPRCSRPHRQWEAAGGGGEVAPRKSGLPKPGTRGPLSARGREALTVDRSTGSALDQSLGH